MPRSKCKNPSITPKRERVQPLSSTERSRLHRLRQKERQSKPLGEDKPGSDRSGTSGGPKLQASPTPSISGVHPKTQTTILSCLRRSEESNETTHEVPRVKTMVNSGPSMSLLHTPMSRYAGADKQLSVRFQNEFGCRCDVCDRLWFKNDKKCQPKTFAALTEAFVAGIDFPKYSACRKYHRPILHKFPAATCETNK